MRRTYPKIGGTGAEKTAPTASAEAVGTIKDAYDGIVVQSLSTNTASVYIGDSTVTTGTGLELEPGDGVNLPVQDSAQIYCISGTAGQKLRVMAI